MEAEKIGRLRDMLENGLEKMPGVYVNGKTPHRLYNTSNLCFSGIKAEDIINAVKTSIAVSTGSACTSEDQQPSHVLLAMGLDPRDAYSSVRFSLGKYTTEDEIRQVVEIISDWVAERISEE